MEKAFAVASYWTHAASLIVLEEMREDEEAKPDGRKNPRRRRRRIAHSETIWARLLQEDRDELQDPSSREAELFRLRFRVPFSLFLSCEIYKIVASS